MTNIRYVQVLIVNIGLPQVEKIKDGLHVFGLGTFEIDQWVWMFVLLKDFLKERTGGSEDQLVCLHLLTIFTHQGHICKVFVSSEPPESGANIGFEVLPLHPIMLF